MLVTPDHLARQDHGFPRAHDRSIARPAALATCCANGKSKGRTDRTSQAALWPRPSTNRLRCITPGQASWRVHRRARPLDSTPRRIALRPQRSHSAVARRSGC